jgi:hypothetical protein
MRRIAQTSGPLVSSKGGISHGQKQVENCDGDAALERRKSIVGHFV